MNRTVLFCLLTSAFFVSCGVKKQAGNGGVTREDLTFPVGEKIESPAFSGDAYLQNLIANDTLFNFPQTNCVTFSPGSHSSWHRHGGMVVLVTGGVGIYQEEGKPAQVLRKGDVLQIEAGVRHWHGATNDNWFSQVVVYDMSWTRPEGLADDGDNAVADDYYDQLVLEEYAHPATADGLMFATPDEPVSLPTFTGPVRLAGTLGEENAAGAPSLHYVVFEPGVYNAWHSHAGGQILIVTDGVGYHQIEGQPVEVLRTGDVVQCPPGVRHWHGATPNSRFAHLAANTNPERPGVEWYELLPREGYEQLQKGDKR
ncbi:MAG: cupin domain-containing protein [Prevotella sp.]|nr:cupin domain-containing protein [Prevotella sp.]